MSDVEARQEARLLLGARNYADASKSDPFAYARALTHIRMGLCGACEKSEMLWREHATPKSKLIFIGPEPGSAGHYEATPTPAGFINIARM